MKVLIVGGGGREHAIAWKVAQSHLVERVFVAPGNAGTALESTTENVNIDAEDIDSLLEFARDQQIELTIVGPEAPLVLGIVDRFEQVGMKCFGPTRAAAQLEGSKSFAKEFLSRHQIPTAAYRCFDRRDEVEEFLRNSPMPIVIKQDGLAAGKGVVIAHNLDQALQAVRQFMIDDRPDVKLVVEDYLQGDEVSFICMVDGENILPLASSQDHKARDDGDTGPNTGGMGAYSPAPIVTDDLHQKIMQQIIRPTVRGLISEGTPFTGFLYAGLMVSPAHSVQVLEYNCRLGDPETQPLLMRLNSDFAKLCQLAVHGRLDQASTSWDPRVALGVVMAAQGYPGPYQKGLEIKGLNSEDDDTVKTFHAGTRLENDVIVTSGGRVLCVTALGNEVSDARSVAYRAVSGINWPGAFWRSDIGYRAVRN